MDEATRHLFGRTLRQIRIDARLSQHQLARQVPVSQATLSRYESGSQAPDESTAARLDELLDTGGTLGRLVAATPPQVPSAMDVDDMRRRALFGLMGGAALNGAAGAFEPVRRRLDAALTGPVTEDDAVEWERVADQYSRLGDRVPAERVLPGLLIDLDDARCQVPEVPERLRLRLLRVCALLGGLAAISLAGAGQWNDAGRYWRTAQRAARLSEDRTVSCLIAGRRAVLSLYAPGDNDRVGLARTPTSPCAQFCLFLFGERPRSGGGPRCRARFVYAAASAGCGASPDHRAMSIIASGDPSLGARYLVNALESLDPAFRRGSLRTSAEHALRALPDRARRLPEVRRARELTSEETSR